MHRSPAGRIAALALVLLAGGAVHASPTPNEFEACHKLAAAVLRACLDQAPGRLDEACWRQSHERAVTCHAQVRDGHDREAEQARAAARRARDAALRSQNPSVRP